MRIKSLAITSLAAASLVLGACASMDDTSSSAGSTRTATAPSDTSTTMGTDSSATMGTDSSSATTGAMGTSGAPSSDSPSSSDRASSMSTAPSSSSSSTSGATSPGETSSTGAPATTPPGSTAGAVAGAAAADAATDPTQRVASAAGRSTTFDCDDGRSFVATYDDPAYNGATSIAMQAGPSGEAGTPPSGNMQVSLGENTATLKDGDTTINCRARQ